MKASPKHAIPLLGALLLVPTGCASPADHPSLQPRPIEKIANEPEPPVAPPPVAGVPDDRIAPLVAAARAAHVRFAGQADGVRTVVVQAAGAAPGSEAWVAAQQQITRLDSLRVGVAQSLAELDALALKGVSDPLLVTALGEVAGLDAAERDAIAELEGRLSPP